LQGYRVFQLRVWGGVSIITESRPALRRAPSISRLAKSKTETAQKQKPSFGAASTVGTCRHA